MRRQRNYRSSFLAKRSEKKAKRKLIFTLLIGVILLYSIFTWLMPALIGGLTFFNQYKSQPKKETPISEKTTLAPPILNIPFEATNSAKISIKGYATPVTKVEIYLDQELAKDTRTEDDGSFSLDGITLSLGTNNIYGQTVDDQGNKSLPSKLITIIYDRDKPSLSLKEPADNQIIKGDRRVTVSGSVDPQDTVLVNINDNRVIVDSSGNFSQTIEISDGENNFQITAEDKAGNITQISRIVTFEP